MVSRKQKLLAAGAVLAVGFVAAWLFRRGPEEQAAAPVWRATPVLAPSAAVRLPAIPSAPTAKSVLDGQFSPMPPLAASNAGLHSTSISAPTASLPPAPSLEPLTLPADGDAEADLGGDSSSPPYRIHVVQNSDTLERLAERYLGDGGRSLELFDLNRDVLENPHLLPINAQLRIPAAAPTAED